MRICYLGNLRDIHIRRWLEYFVNQGHEVHLLTNYTSPSLKGVKIHLILPDFLRPEWNKRAVLSSLWYTHRLIKEIQPELLHALYLIPYGWIGAISGFHPLVVTLLGGDIMPERGALKFPWNLLTAFTLKRADLVTGNSPILLTVAERYMKPTTKRRIIRIGANLNHFNPSVEIGTWKIQLDLIDRPVIFSPRRFHPICNIQTIVAAIPQVLEQIPNACFVFKDKLVGSDEPYQAQIREMITEMEIDKAIRYVGEVSYYEMAQLYRLADVVVSVALSEGFPVSVFEAMACGVPLVLGKIPQLEELIVDEQHTLFVPTQDPDKLADAIIRLLKDKTLRQEMITANLALVDAQGNFDAEMAKMEEIYQQIRLYTTPDLSL